MNCTGDTKRHSISMETKKTIINMLETGTLSRKQASINFRLPYSTISNIYKKYSTNCELTVKKRGGSRGNKLSNDQIAVLRSWLDENCALTLAQLKAKVMSELGINICITTINNYISSFNYSFKRVQNIAMAAMTEDLIDTRREYAARFLNIYHGTRPIIYFDETGFQVSMRKHYGRSMAGSRAQIRVPALKTRNITVMAAMTQNELLYYKTLDGPGNRVRLADYLNGLFESMGNKNLINAYIIMDNAIFHKCVEIKEAISLAGHELLFLPPYSPFFNPIENMFAQWKSLVRTACSNNENELLAAIRSFESIIKVEQCNNYVKHVVNNAVSCLSGFLVINE